MPRAGWRQPSHRSGRGARETRARPDHVANTGATRAGRGDSVDVQQDRGLRLGRGPGQPNDLRAALGARAEKRTGGESIVRVEADIAVEADRIMSWLRLHAVSP